LSKVFKKQKKTGTDSQYQSPLTETSKLNSFLSDKSEELDLSEIETNSEMVKRFNTFYGDSLADDESRTFMKPYQQIYTASFPPNYLRTDPVSEKEIEQKIKDKYYSNPVYKALLAADIDFFLKRQPQTFRVTADQEADLYTKRRILESYYDSLRKYSDLPYNEFFDSFFDGAKSFSNKVYNQQFKGTLRSVRRLFALRLDQDSKPAQTLLKFDQPLYEFSEKSAFSPYHEELINQPKKPQNQFPFKNDFVNQPLYAGWDEQLRKFVITNKFLPRTLAGYKVNIDNETRRKFSQDSKKQVQKIKFTAWPLSSQKVSVQKLESDIPYVTLFQPVDTKIQESLNIEGDFSTLPSNLERLLRLQAQKGEIQDTHETFESLAPKRGGFVWPGNTKFKFPFSLNT
jgi:hypothetical protein